MEYAPVLIITLCRFQHFKRCIDSLTQNKSAEHTIVYIALDYPSKDEHWYGYNEIVNYLPNVKGFKEIIIIKRKSNYGALKNYTNAMEFIFSKHERCIFSEDDNEFSEIFLEYMNLSLDKYYSNPNVFSISGYNYLIDMSDYSNNVFFTHAFCAWGVGYWKHKFLQIEDIYNTEYIASILNSYRKTFLLFRKRFKGISYLLYMLKHNEIYNDVITTCHSYIENQYSLFPKVSKVRNWGNDGSGVHCGYSKRYELQEIDTDSEFSIDDISVSEPLIITKQISKYFSISTFKKGITLLRYVYYRMTHRFL